MARHSCLMVTSVMLVSLVCLIAFAGSCADPPAPGTFEAAEGLLDVRRSVMVMFAVTECMGWSPTQAVVFPLHRLNPKAQKYARFFLDNDTRVRDHYVPRMGALLILAYVGDNTSVPFVDQYIQAWLKSGVNDHRPMSHSLGHCMGVFGGAAVKRDLPGATAFVEKYSRFNSWLQDTENPSPMALTNASRFCKPFVCGVFQFSRAEFVRPYLDQKIPGTNRRLVPESYVKTLVNLPYAYYTELMKPRPVPTRGKYKGYFEERFAERASRIDALIAEADGMPVPEPVAAENEKLLTVDETMGVIFRGPFDYHLFRRANPDARLAIHAFLEDEVLVGYHPQAIRLLGWIGETSDVVALREIVDRLEGPLESQQRRKLEAIFEAWATMARRGVAGADAEIKRFCAPRAWTGAAFSWLHPAVVKDHPQYAYDGPIEAIRIYSIHGDGNMKELREQLLSEVQHQGARDRINYYLTEERIIAAIEKRREQQARPVTAQDRERLRGQLERMKALAAGQKVTPAKEAPKGFSRKA